MKIRKLETLHCDAGWRNFFFLKITTDNGLVGWSEYSEGWGYGGVTPVIARFGAELIGADPRRVEAISARLHAMIRPSRGGVLHGAVAAIENARLDLKAKALGIPVAELFGGIVRDRLPVYWSHCGTYRARHADILGVAPLKSLDDLVRLGDEVRRRGFKALKTNYLQFDGGGFANFSPGTARSSGWPELNCDAALLDGIRDQLSALRQGAGPQMGLLLDINFNFKTEGFIAVARAAEAARLVWLELDSYDPAALSLVRHAAPMPVASCEHLFGRRDYRPFLDAYAMDVTIVDVMWNGYLESLKIAAMAEAYEVNVAPHNYYGPLADLMAAHFAAVVPNFRIMEIDIDTVPWQRDLVNHPGTVEHGQFLLPDRPGWGAEVNEEAVRAHPAKRG